jgi:4-hydroxyphenylpyruvate dioxygenase
MPARAIAAPIERGRGRDELSTVMEPCLASWVFGPYTRAQSSENCIVGIMKTCIATVSIPGSFREKISAISNAGFDAIELFEPDLTASGLAPGDAAGLVRDHGLEIAILQPFRDFEGRPDQYRNAAFDEAERKFDLMRELGTDLLLVCSAVAPEYSGELNRIVEDFSRLGDMAAARNIRVGYEALAWGTHVRDVAQAWELVQKCNHPNVGIILDSFHTLLRQNDTDFIREIPGDRIFFLQIADAPLIKMDVQQLSRHHRTIPGKGDLNIESVVRAVLSTGYDGPLSLEIFRTSFPQGTSLQIARENYASLLRLIELTATPVAGSSPAG